jgi:hypothetical protein
LEDGLIAAGCKKVIWCFLQQGAAARFRMWASIRAEINFYMHRVAAAEFNHRRCPINISKLGMWVPDLTSRDVISYLLFVNHYQFHSKLSAAGCWSLAFCFWLLALRYFLLVIP